MLTMTEKSSGGKKATALIAALCLLTPLFALPAQAQLFGQRPQQPAQPRQGMSKGKKVAALAGAALLYYLWKRHNAGRQQQAAMNPNTGTGAQVLPGGNGTMTNTARRPQLYRSKNGGVYYRDAQNRPVWLTVPNRPVQVPVADLQRYAPNYARYRGPAPAAPSGYRTQSFGEFNPNLGSAYGGNSGNGSMGNMPPGPRG